MRPARCLDQRRRLAGGLVEPIEAGIGVGLENAAEALKMALGMIAAAVARIEEHRRRRVRAPERAVVAHVDPGPRRRRLAPGQHRHRRVVAMHPAAGKDMGADEVVERPQKNGAAADLVGQRRQADIDALAPIALRLPVERLMLAILLKQHHCQQTRAGKAARQHMEGRRRLADRLTATTGELLAHILHHLPLPRHHLQRLGHVLAELG